MQPIIFNRADIRDLAREMIARGFCTGVKPVESDISDFRARYAAAIRYIDMITRPCPPYMELARSIGDYVQTGHGYQKTLIPGAMVENAISTVLHEMCENCSVKPVCCAANDEFELREIEECNYAFEQIKNENREFVYHRVCELGFDAVHLHNDYINGLQVVINGTDRYKVKYRVYFGDQIIGEIE